MEEGRDGEEANGENSVDGGNSNSSSRCNGSDIISFKFMQKVYMRPDIENGSFVQRR
jgi:hypothetical protein